MTLWEFFSDSDRAVATAIGVGASIAFVVFFIYMDVIPYFRRRALYKKSAVTTPPPSDGSVNDGPSPELQLAMEQGITARYFKQLEGFTDQELHIYCNICDVLGTGSPRRVWHVLEARKTRGKETSVWDRLD